MTSYYVVRRGHTPGIYTNHHDMMKQIKNFSNPEYKKMEKLQSAKAYAYIKKGCKINELIKINPKTRRYLTYINDLSNKPNSIVLFTDGSYKHTKHYPYVYGYGFLLIKNGEVIQEFFGGGSNNYISKFESVGAEVSALLKALSIIIKYFDDIHDIYIFHDFAQLKDWVIGISEVKNELGKKYIKFIQKIQKKYNINLHFQKVKGHSNDIINERVDQLAKQGMNRERKRLKKERKNENKMSKFYAVKKGRKTGIYTSWDECLEQVKGYSGAVYKRFNNKEEALNFIKNNDETLDFDDKNVKEIDEITKKLSSMDNHLVLYVDGSSQPHEKDGPYGYGFLVVKNNEKIYEDYGGGNNPQINQMNNVAGEIIAVLKGIQWIHKNYPNVNNISIFHDYTGLKHWVDGDWKAKNEFTQKYASSINSFQEKEGVKIDFYKVKSHNKQKFNERVDELAKKGLQEQLVKL